MEQKKAHVFWAGSTVRETEIADIPAYNRANGQMRIVFSLPLWLSTFLALWNEGIALILIAADCLIGLPVLVVVYKRIYAKYKA